MESFKKYKKILADLLELNKKQEQQSELDTAQLTGLKEAREILTRVLEILEFEKNHDHLVEALQNDKLRELLGEENIESLLRDVNKICDKYTLSYNILCGSIIAV